MTPTEQDNELRSLISDVMADLMVDVSLKKLSKHDGGPIERGRLYLESHNNRLDIIMQLIAADRKRVELEARIDELTKLRRMFERLAEYAGHKEQVMSEYDDRIAELKAQQEGME